eukprot:189966_1
MMSKKRKLQLDPNSVNDEPAKKRQRTDRNSNRVSLPFDIEYFGGSDKGKKPHMEDRRIAIADLSTKFDHPFTAQNKCRIFCVIDGHGGHAVSSYCQTHIVDQFIENLNKYVISKQGTDNHAVTEHEDIQRALHATFKMLDETILNIIGSKSEGATCTLVYFHNEMVFTANVGDSKAVLARMSPDKDHMDENKIEPMLVTKDHTVLQLSEVKRIESKRGRIVNGRVNGILEVTRSFGDPEMKKIGVIAAPNLSKFRVNARDKFMMIACDGLWSVFSLSDAVEFVHSKLAELSKPSVEEVTRTLLADAILNKQAKDNVSAIIVRFNHE